MSDIRDYYCSLVEYDKLHPTCIVIGETMEYELYQLDHLLVLTAACAEQVVRSSFTLSCTNTMT